MPHFPKPYFREKRQTWMVQINGHQHNLGRDRDTAFQKYHELMATPVPEPQPARPSEFVLSVIERFLEWCQGHRAPDTYEWYRWRLQIFADSIPRNLTVAQLKHYHIDESLKKKQNWANGSKHNLARAVMRAFRWAQRKGYIEHNPVADYEKARPGKRNVVVSPREFETILAMAGSDEFRDLLQFTWETAARPQESLVATARHVDLANQRIVFPPDESKGEQWPRIIYLTETALLIIEKLVLKHPDGPLFRNSEGVPWTTDAANCGFIRIQLRLGQQKLRELGIEIPPIPKLKRVHLATLAPNDRRQQLEKRHSLLRDRQRQLAALARKHGKKYCLYNLRHSWLDRALKRGVDALTCAILMGHRDPSTISKVYQHLSQSPEFLASQARKAVS